jgi:hypothetical protein
MALMEAVEGRLYASPAALVSKLVSKGLELL